MWSRGRFVCHSLARGGRARRHRGAVGIPSPPTRGGSQPPRAKQFPAIAHVRRARKVLPTGAESHLDLGGAGGSFPPARAVLSAWEVQRAYSDLHAKAPPSPGGRCPAPEQHAQGERDRWSAGGQSAAEGGGAKRWPEEDRRSLSLLHTRSRYPRLGPTTPARGTSCTSSPTHKDKDHSAPDPW